jgi:alkane 1-monooxygenase
VFERLLNNNNFTNTLLTMNIRAFKYLSPFIVFALAYISFTSKGWLTFLPVIWSYVLIPLTELLIKPDTSNLSDVEEQIAKEDRVYDYLLYLVPVLLYGMLIFFLYSLQQQYLHVWDYIGRVMSMGLLLGIFGINVAHELGHRVDRFEQFLAKALLLTSQYMHFFIEHNRGHHKRVATPNDPSSARLNEPLFLFYYRTVLRSYISAWQIAIKDVRKKGGKVVSWQNEMMRYTIIQVTFLLTIFFILGGLITLCYIIAAILGIGLLEAVNYIEHYGLQRKEIAPGKYERAMPYHSWNSDHVIGRLVLFELSRHSDHHYMASRKYQILRHHNNSPQMPTGYPGMMILAHIPPLFFYVMRKQIQKYSFSS